MHTVIMSTEDSLFKVILSTEDFKLWALPFTEDCCNSICQWCSLLQTGLISMNNGTYQIQD